MKTVANFFSVLALVLLTFVTGCSKDDDRLEEVVEPVAQFSSEVAPGNPQLISFINTSSKAEEFFWDFGDGSEISTQKHPTHSYGSAGEYTVTLTAVNGEKKDEISQQLTVVGIPTADFGYVADQDDPNTIHFENLSQNTSDFVWDFGDGSESSTEKNPSHTYATTGTYTVILSATGAGGTDQKTLEVEVKDAQPAFNELYIVGDASESGWNIATPEALVQSSENPFIFTYEGVLTPGKFKFSAFTGDWCDGQWLNAPAPETFIAPSTGYIVTTACEGPDNQWTVTQETQGRYKITVDLKTETVSFEQMNPQYSELYAIGDATPNGWVPQTPQESFVQNPADPFVFTYQTYLNPGELKIATFKGEWCDGDWLNAAEAGQPIADAQYIITTGCEGPDNKWVVTEMTQGNYLITVDLYNGTIFFEAQ